MCPGFLILLLFAYIFLLVTYMACCYIGEKCILTHAGIVLVCWAVTVSACSCGEVYACLFLWTTIMFGCHQLVVFCLTGFISKLFHMTLWERWDIKPYSITNFKAHCKFHDYCVCVSVANVVLGDVVWYWHNYMLYIQTFSVMTNIYFKFIKLHHFCYIQNSQSKLNLYNDHLHSTKQIFAHFLLVCHH